MKKIIVGIISVIVVAILGFWIWSQRPGLQAEDVLAANPLFYARLNHVEKHVNQLINSDFGKNVSSINVADVLNRNNFAASDIETILRWQKDAAKFWNNPVTKRFLGKEIAVAVYHKDNDYQVLIALRLSLSTRLMELIGQLSNHWGDDISVHRVQYQGRSINFLKFKKQDLEISYVRIRDLLIVSPESNGHLQDIIDVYQHKTPALAEDLSYNLISQNAYPKADGLVFLNINSLLDIWHNEMDSTALSSLGDKAAAFPVYGLSYLPGDISKFKMLVGIDQRHVPSEMRHVFNCPASLNDTFKFVPIEAIAYNWSGCYDFEQSWGMAKRKLLEYPQLSDEVEKYKSKFERHFQINIRRDILPLLGREVGAYLTDVDMQGSYPFPRLLVFVKVNDRAATERILNKITQGPYTILQSEDYNQVKIHYITSSLGANMDPGYCLLDNYLLIATTRQLLKRSIDAYNDSMRSIASDDVISQFSLSNGEKFHSVTLMKTGDLSRRAQDFLGWLDRYLSGQVTMAAAYKQDGNNKQHELDEAIADKSAELLLAQKKLIELKSSALSDVSVEDPDIVNGAIANLSREEQSIRDDISTFNQQKQDISNMLDNYALGAQSDKLAMYNMDNIVSPVLKGLESINAQAVTVRFGEKIWETEFLVK